MCAEGKSTPVTASVRNNDATSRNRLGSYPEVGNYIHKKFATDKTIAEFEKAILHYMQKSNMTL